jgi:hypothetical protein
MGQVGETKMSNFKLFAAASKAAGSVSGSKRKTCSSSTVTSDIAVGSDPEIVMAR